MDARNRSLEGTHKPLLASLSRLQAGLKDLLADIHEDWTVNSKDWTMPGFRALMVHRVGNWVSNRRPGVLKSALLMLYRTMYRYVRNRYGIEIPLTTTIAAAAAHHNLTAILYTHGNRID